jgi:hypothetical protein
MEKGENVVSHIHMVNVYVGHAVTESFYLGFSTSEVSLQAKQIKASIFDNKRAHNILSVHYDSRSRELSSQPQTLLLQRE